MSINFETDIGKIRLLLSDVDESAFVFSDNELQAFLDMEGGSLKLAAAQAIDTNATNQALALKVLKTETGLSTNGAVLADAMRKHATALREQAGVADGYFELVTPARPCYPELTERPWRVW